MPPLVSIIVPTKNSSRFLDDCLTSVRLQSYREIELIVVDNFSTDGTPSIAGKYADMVYSQGPERSAQRNYGAEKSSGKYVFFVDSDMVLSEHVVSACVEKLEAHEGCGGVIIPEESFGVGFWARCKQLERSFYVGIDWIEAARFFGRNIFREAGGYDEKMMSGEDWDLSQRVCAKHGIARISEYIFHNEGTPDLYGIIRKKYKYAKNFIHYTDKQERSASMRKQTGVAARYAIFLSRPKKLFRDPVLGIGMLFMKTCEFFFGGIGYMASKLERGRTARFLPPQKMRAIAKKTGAKRYAGAASVLLIFLLITRGILSKRLAYSDFVPFSDDYGRTLEKFFFMWNTDFVGLFEPKSISYLFNSFFELLSFGNAVVAQNLYILTFFAIGYLGMYLLLRRYDVHPLINHIVPFFFIINPVMASELSNGVTAILIIYNCIPLLFLAFGDLLRKYDRDKGLLLSVIVAINLMSIQTAIWVMGSLGIYLLVDAFFGGIKIKNLFYIFLHGCLGVLLNAISLLTFFGFSRSYANLSYLATFRHTYAETDYYNLFRLVGNNGSSQPFLGYFDKDILGGLTFVFFGIIILYFLRLKRTTARAEKVMAVFAMSQLLLSMLFMNLVRAGSLDGLINAKNLLVVSARNPQKLFYVYAFCFILLFGLAFDRLLRYAAKRYDKRTALVLMILVTGTYLAHNKHFFDGDFGLSLTREENSYYIENKYEKLFAQLGQLDEKSQLLYLPFDYQLQLKTYWQENIVKYRMGGNMLDGERNSDVLASLYDNICEGGTAVDLVNDKLNIDYIVLDKHPATDIDHDPYRDCAMEPYYETPYIWGRYEYFDRLFGGYDVYYEDDDFKVLKIKKDENPEIFAIDKVFELNNTSDLYLKYDFVRKELHHDFNFVLRNDDKTDNFTIVEELFYKEADSRHEEDRPLSANKNSIYFNTAETNLYYDTAGGRLKIYSGLENNLYLDGENISTDGSGGIRILYDGAMLSEKKYFLEINTRLIALEPGKKENLGLLNDNDTIRLRFVADPFRDLGGLKLSKTNAKDVYYYNNMLWRTNPKNAKMLQKSADDGSTWEDLYTFENYLTDPIIVTADGTVMVQQDPNDYWADPPADIYRSTDGGRSFTKTFTLSRGGLATWSFDIKGNGILLGEYGEYGSGRVYLSEDSGVTWRMVFRCPEEIVEDAHIHKVLFDPYLDNVFYASNGDTDTSRSVWYTRNAGVSWQRITDRDQPTWMEATRDYLFLFGDLTGRISRIRKEDLFAENFTIETVYDVARDERADFGLLSFYGGRIDFDGNIFAGGVAYGENDTRKNDKDAGLLMSSDNGDSWNIIKVYKRRPEVSSGASFLSQETPSGKIYIEINNATDEILNLEDFHGFDIGEAAGYHYSEDDNMITNASFQEGLWDSRVGDCNAYDNNPLLDIKLGLDKESGNEYLQLEAQRHYSCTTNNFQLRGDTEYLFSFDYQSPNAKKAGYYLQFDDDDQTTVTEKILLDDTAWHNYAKMIKSPKGATSARLFLYAYSSDEKTNIINRYDNFSLLRLNTEKIINIEYKPAFVNKNISFRDGGVFEFKNSTYGYGNIFPEGSFTDGLWQDEVGDCNDYDDLPEISMALVGGTEKKDRHLELRAKRHNACTAKTFPVKEKTDYLFSFDYQSPNARKVGYYLEFNDAFGTVFGATIDVAGGDWQRFEKRIGSPDGASSAKLYIYAYESDKKTTNVAHYDDFSFVEIPALENRYYFVSDPQIDLSEPRSVTTEFINPTRRSIRIKGATTPFFLAMSQSYHDGWQLAVKNDEKEGLLYGWIPSTPPDKISDRYHLKLNNFLNAWYVDTPSLCATDGLCVKNADGTYDIDLTIEFTPQRWFYLLLLISALTALGVLGLLLYPAKRKSARKIKHE